MPFQFRMGYIFIILFMIFVTITFVDSTKVASEEVDEADRKKMLKWARITLFFSMLFILSATIHKLLLVSGSSNEWIVYLENIGFEAFFFFGSLIFSISLFLFSNANSRYRDNKAVPFDLSLFKTDKGFALGALGICILVTLIYILLW